MTAKIYLHPACTLPQMARLICAQTGRVTLIDSDGNIRLISTTLAAPERLARTIIERMKK